MTQNMSFGKYFNIKFILTLLMKLQRYQKSGTPMILKIKVFSVVPLRFRKAGSMWCGGARDTH